jgi:hypothetical protein
MKTYKVKVRKGYLGDFAREWWTDEDHVTWDKHVEQLKADGTFGEESTVEISLIHNPKLDACQLYSPLQSARFDFLDFSKPLPNE